MDKSVIIYGIYKTLPKLLNMINFKVIGFVYNKNSNSQNFILNNYLLIKLDELHKIKYDYIIIYFDHENIKNILIRNNVDAEKFLYYYYDGNKINFDLFSGKSMFNYKLKSFLEKKNINLLILGSSYPFYGINSNNLICPSFNFALSSQDLFYDFKIIEYICKHYFDKFKQIKYLIMGLCYMSFSWDMSKFNDTANKVICYYPILKNPHNYKNKDLIIYLYNQYKIMINNLDIRLNETLLKEFYFIEKDFDFDIQDYLKERIYCNSLLKIGEINYEYINKLLLSDYNDIIRPTRDKTKREMNSIEIKLGKFIANKHAEWINEEIIKENIIIFNSLMEFLKKFNIKPIIIIFPTPISYYCYFNNYITKQFYEIIDFFKNKFDISIFDYFNSAIFSNKDFSDASHLNINGSAKMTKIVNNILNTI